LGIKVEHFMLIKKIETRNSDDKILTEMFR
jgi:hypothetical protein